MKTPTALRYIDTVFLYFHFIISPASQSHLFIYRMGYDIFLSLHLFGLTDDLITPSLKSLALLYGYVRPSRRISGM